MLKNQEYVDGPAASPDEMRLLRCDCSSPGIAASGIEEQAAFHGWTEARLEAFALRRISTYRHNGG